MVLTDGKWAGNVVALPNNRVRVTSPAFWVTGEGAPDFRPSQFTHCAEQDDSYMDSDVTFDNLYRDNFNENSEGLYTGVRDGDGESSDE